MNPAVASPPRLSDPQLATLLELLDVPGPSGFEAAAADVWLRAASEFADVEQDAMGNCYATVNRGAAQRVLLAGHIDEIGFIITAIDRERGLLRFEGIGGWNLQVVVGQRVKILTEQGPVLGAVGWLSPHQLEDERFPKYKDLWIDVGARDGDELEALVRVGDPVVIDTTPHLYPSRRLMSRSVDNRIGCFVALEAARRCVGADVEVIACAVVSEETTQFGAVTSAYRVRPDAAVVIDVIWTSDVPGDHAEDALLGKGPMVTFGAAAQTRIGTELVRTADERGIPLQLNGAGTYTSTDADQMVAAGRGVTTGLVSIPTRYLHSPGELFDLADAEWSIELLAAWARHRAGA